MTDQVWVEVVGQLVIARLRGEPNEEVLRECQERVLSLVRDGPGKVLYDALEMKPPPMDVPWAQRELDEKLGSVKLRRAIVVPDSKLAYLARLALVTGITVFFTTISSRR